jgi:sarcosine oxidase subunit beta
MLDRFEDEIGQAIGLRYDGYLLLATNERDVEIFRRNVALQHNLGIATEWLDGDEVRWRVPQLAAEDVIAATFHQRDGLADPHGVVAGYISAARRLGVKAFTDVPVTGIEVVAGRIAGVRTPHGGIACETVVNAAGPWAGLIGEMAGVALPITPIRRQMLTTNALPHLAPDFPFVIDFAQSLYFHREGAGILTGMSNPNQEPGFDESVDESWELVHLEAAAARLPLLHEAGLLARWAGLYEVTPDAHPIIDRLPEPEGFVVVTGFSGHGFMHGPIAGLLVAEIILDGNSSTLDISDLNYQRFATGRLIREYNVI